MRSSRIPRPGAGTVAAGVLAIPPTLAHHYLGTAAAIVVAVATTAGAALGLAATASGHHVRGMRYVSVVVRADDGTVTELDPRTTSIGELTR